MRACICIRAIGSAAASGFAHARVFLSDLRKAIREARDLEAKLSGDGYPLVDG